MAYSLISAAAHLGRDFYLSIGAFSFFFMNSASIMGNLPHKHLKNKGSFCNFHVYPQAGFLCCGKPARWRTIRVKLSGKKEMPSFEMKFLGKDCSISNKFVWRCQKTNQREVVQFEHQSKFSGKQGARYDIEKIYVLALISTKQPKSTHL